ncbi:MULTISPECIES: hypothetical protein [Cellulophaga]|uniref:Uncharacterized protein n=2 Tax=Cellulophaga TaxID=104264 RepID=F0RCT8_CELLC|nr:MULTISPECIES: hypothetical protein [Cellulophaga]ADY30820.1 hypothetical protein Celly_3003 [Cellulophaga lytica DSM 7489]APU11717.1 hypothetical protein A5M85_15945 [Cellulophaga lytica]EWH12414.1 hypothetical protein KLA_14835 [Cellulophaga geojensis KL-A]TVZ09844.1 hypothetical protein JM80_2376 [Cellulophaga sp. RHA_52]WQG78259.1 hypothetical protein SR888_04865 [Cellulophaga lytica]
MSKKIIPFIVIFFCLLLILMHLLTADFNNLSIGFYVGIASATIVTIAMIFNIRARNRGEIE